MADSGVNTMLIDEYLPAYHITEIHQTDIRATPKRVWAAIHEVTTAQLPLFHLLMGIRMLPARLAGQDVSGIVPDGPLINWADEIGFLLGERPGRELVFGIAGQFWRLRGSALASLHTPDEFMAFDTPGNARVATNFIITPGAAPGRTHLRTETRIQAMDVAALRKFRAYWTIIYPGSSLIRREWMWAIRKQAEQGNSS